MKILVTGSRDWTDKVKIASRLAQTIWDSPANESFEVIHGGARGADCLAGEIARAAGLPVVVIKAEWDRYGRAAGAIRNSKMMGMLDSNKDVVLAFWKDNSRGTKDCINQATKRGIKVVITYG